MSQKKSQNAKNKTAAAAKKKTQTKTNAKVQSRNTSLTPTGLFISIGFAALSLFCLLSLISPSLTGNLGGVFNKVLTGVFGICSVLVPIYLTLLAIFWNKYIYRGSLFITKAVCGVLTMTVLPSFFSSVMLGTHTTYTPSQLYAFGNSWKGGGVVGGTIAQFLGKYINIFSPVLTLISALVLILLTFGVTPSKAFNVISDLAIRLRSDFSARAEANEEKKQSEQFDPIDDISLNDHEDIEQSEKEPVRKKKSKPIFTKKELDADEELALGMTGKQNTVDSDIEPDDRVIPVYKPKKTKPKQDDDELNKIIDNILDNPQKTDDTEISVESDEETLPFDIETKEEKKKVKITKYEPVGTQQKLDDDELTYTCEPIGDIPEEPAEPVYKFPPISLLKSEVNESRDVTAELEANSEKLMQLLEDFNVKAEVTHISNGPTITRYEVKPAPGVRVAAISKLVDDISMSFGTMGVRIEAPIPGKEAVGIEVPNRDVSTVRLRSLIESDDFKNAESKLFCALGKDVVGDPVYLDIAKMPHLLIAGATGMGKSVCINSLITSILYKASPDDVKLILIDPKKVEFVPYANLPHLLTPVVSDPKKAAGALHWAVSEMERRYDLIESVGVRNIFGYNEITASDPEKEKLPQVVIIIDELADLMMTAKQDVEQSIARLAQKARAAGMHLILGTQRPSVSIVTGLIKANVPSRIACKMASQVDSRTVLDIAGAEKLIGRGDMLYAPVGIAKPRRLQGAFVSDSEVEAVTSYIRKCMGTPEYARDIIDKIEKEALTVGNKHGSDDIFDPDDSGERDELLLPAIEFAFEQGKVSTSLFQRKLSIGYGRAAKIIDCMQAMGVCSAAEGNKPRTLTMTREEYYERYGE